MVPVLRSASAFGVPGAIAAMESYPFSRKIAFRRHENDVDSLCTEHGGRLGRSRPVH